MEPEKIYDSPRDFKRKIATSRNALLSRWATVCQMRGAEMAIFDSKGHGVRSFSDLNTRAEEVADRIRSRISPSAVVALQGRNDASWIESLLGIWMADGVVLLEDLSLTTAARAAAEQTTGAVLRISDESDLPQWDLISTNIRGLDLGGDVQLIKLTSGTTGAPRAVLFNTTQLAADCDAICSTMGIGPKDRNFGVIAFSHSYGFSNLVTPLLCHGVAVIASGDALPRAIINGVARAQATVLPAVPAIFDSMAALEGEMPTLRLCISAGAPLRMAVADAFRDRFGVKLHSFYGASECGGICYDRSNDSITTDGFVGTPMDNVIVERREATLEASLVRITTTAVGIGTVPISEDGGLDGLGTFCPADLLAGDALGGFRIVGRLSDWINIAGRKLDPAEVEDVLRALPGVHDAVVIGLDDSRRGQKVCALVAGDSSIVSLESLQRHCKSLLQRWQIPREIRVVAALPTNARGKISRPQIASTWNT